MIEPPLKFVAIEFGVDKDNIQILKIEPQSLNRIFFLSKCLLLFFIDARSLSKLALFSIVGYVRARLVIECGFPTLGYDII